MIRILKLLVLNPVLVDCNTPIVSGRLTGCDPPLFTDSVIFELLVNLYNLF